MQGLGGGGAGASGGEQPVQRGLTGLGVVPAVVDGLDPGPEQPVELGQVADRSGDALAAELDQELLPDGAGRVGRAARCLLLQVLFRAASPPNRT